MIFSNPARKLPGPWTRTWSKQYLSAMHPVTCSDLWVRCLFDLISMSDFGGKWPIKWKFSKVSFQISQRDTELRFVTKFGENQPLRSSWKVAWFTKQKKTRVPRDSSQPLFWPKWADRTQNSLNVVTPWHVHVYRILSGSGAFCRIIPEKLIFRPKKSIQWAFSLKSQTVK